MFLKRVLCLIVLFAFLSCGINEMTASAAVIDNNSELTRSTRQFSVTVPGNSIKRGNISFSLEAGEEVSIRATYTPLSADVDFGIVSSGGVFYYINTGNGSIDQTIIVETRDDYTLAVRNNSNSTISASGYVNY